MIAAITLLVVGIVVLAVIAIVVGVIEAAQAPERRWIAAERRAAWEARRPSYHGLDDSRWDED